MKREDIRAALETALEQGQFKELIQTLRVVDQTELFYGLFPLAVLHQWNGPSYAAAFLLLELEPPCPLSCADAIRAMVPQWDVSIEEVPMYLMTQFGKVQMRQVIADLSGQAGSEDERTLLRVIGYWLTHPACDLFRSFTAARTHFPPLKGL